MYLERDRKNSQLSLVDKDEVVLSMSWFFDEFVWMINGIGPIEITREVDETLFNNLCNFSNYIIFLHLQVLSIFYIHLRRIYLFVLLYSLLQLFSS